MTKMSKMHQRVISAQGAVLAFTALMPIAQAVAQTTTAEPERRILERPYLPALLHPRLRQHRLQHLRLAAGLADL